MRDIVCPHLSTAQISILLLESLMTPQELVIPTLLVLGYTDPTSFSKVNQPLFDFDTKFMTVQSLQLVPYPNIFDSCKEQYPFLFTTSSNTNGSTTSSTPSKKTNSKSAEYDMATTASEYDMDANSWSSHSNQGLFGSNDGGLFGAKKTSNGSTNSTLSKSPLANNKKSKNGLDLDNGLFD